jgi:hypothetical protein
MSQEDRPIKMCLSEIYGNFCIGKDLSDSFSIQNGLNQGDALLPLTFQFCFRISHYKGPGNMWG